jgi:hypothetical protein
VVNVFLQGDMVVETTTVWTKMFYQEEVITGSLGQIIIVEHA